jgi:hypothetical protein
MGDGLLSFSFLLTPSSTFLTSVFFLLCAFAPLHLCVFFFSGFFFSGFFFFAAVSGATTGAWNFWCIIGPLRCPS